MAVRKILLYLEEMGVKCHEFEFDTIKYEDLFHYPPLKEIRYSVCKSVMKAVVLEVSMAFHHEMFFITDEKYLIKTNSNKEYLVRI